MSQEKAPQNEEQLLETLKKFVIRIATKENATDVELNAMTVIARDLIAREFALAFSAKKRQPAITSSEDSISKATS